MHVFPERYFGSSEGVEDVNGSMYFDSLTSYKKKFLVPFIKGLPEKARVLDAGCGKGKTVRLITELRPDVEVVGTDITDVSIFLPKGTQFVQCSIDNIASHFELESFDAIICQHVIEHLVYPTAMMYAFHTLLKRKGKLFLETPNWTRLLVPFSPLYFWNDYTHIHPYNITSIRRLYNEYDFDTEYASSVSSVDMGNRIKKTRKSKLGVKNDIQETEVISSKKPLVKKIFDLALDLSIHYFLRDIIVAVASKREVKHEEKPL